MVAFGPQFTVGSIFFDGLAGYGAAVITGALVALLVGWALPSPGVRLVAKALRPLWLNGAHCSHGWAAPRAKLAERWRHAARKARVRVRCAKVQATLRLSEVAGH